MKFGAYAGLTNGGARRGVGGEFLPLLTGLAVRLESTNPIAVTGGKATQWNCTSPEANHVVQADPDHQFTYLASDAAFGGLPSLRIPDLVRYMKSAAFAGGPITQPSTWYVGGVCEATPGEGDYPAADAILFDGLDGTNRNIVESYNGVAVSYAGSPCIGGGANVWAGPCVVAAVFDGDNSVIYPNTTTGISGQSGLSEPAGLTVGALYNGTVGFPGAVVFVLAYRVKHTAPQVASIMTALASKYSITLL